MRSSVPFLQANSLAVVILLFSLTNMACAATVVPTYPERPIRFIVPFPPGGGVDIVARALAREMTEKLGQQVVVDDRPGATGIIGTQIAAQATADGYTLLMGNVATHAINVSMFKKLPYDPVKDFRPITLVARVPEILIVNPSLPVHSVRDLIALAKAKPGQITFGSAGMGSPPHMAAELFKSMAGINIVHIPYKGSTLALNDLLGGRIGMDFSNILSPMRHIKSGRLRALGVTSGKRSIVAPDVPTIAESGLPGFELYSWYGVFAPSATPKAILTRLHQSIAQILTTREVVDRLTSQGADVAPGSPEEFARFIKTEIRTYAKIVKDGGLRVE